MGSNGKRKSKGRPGESKVVYKDGKKERYVWGHVEEIPNWGLIIERDDGNIKLSWEKIVRVDEPAESS